MKKVIAIFAIAAMFAACNNEAETGMTPEDSIRIADSMRRADEDAMRMQDTTSKILEDNSGRMMQDTAK